MFHIKEKRKKKLRVKKVAYNSFGRRDPFLVVEQLAFNNGQINLTEMKLVGIIWNNLQPVAILEHRKESGISMALKIGDTISNGKVAHISQTDVIFEISEYGVLRSYTMKLLPLDERTDP